MGHDHHHHHFDTNSTDSSKNILIAFFLNFTFAIIELIGGYYTNSIAIFSDAIHDFGDSLALLLAYFSEKLSHKKADKKFTFGYRRFSVLSAFLNGAILMTGSLFVLYEAIGRLMNPQVVHPKGMLWLAILGIIVNSIAAFRLSKGKGLNQRMVMYHLFEDLLGWVAVLIVSIVLLFKPLYILDSILSILISFVIFRGVYKNMRKIGAIFLQKFPTELEIKEIIINLKENDLVENVHAIKGWSIDDENFYLSFHICVPEETTIKKLDSLKVKIKKLLLSHRIEYSTIEFEGSSQSSSCSENLKDLPINE